MVVVDVVAAAAVENDQFSVCQFLVFVYQSLGLFLSATFQLCFVLSVPTLGRLAIADIDY